MLTRHRLPQPMPALLGLLLGGSFTALGQPQIAAFIMILGMVAEIALALKTERASGASARREMPCGQEGHSVPTLPLS